MTSCEKIMHSLGFECHQQGDITILDTPFQSRIDGDLFQLFIETTPKGYRITDYGLTLHHAETHATNVANKVQQLHDAFPLAFSEQGQIVVNAQEQSLTEALGVAFNAMQAINQNLPKWKPKPETGHQFRARVAHYFDQREIRYERNYSMTGRSGHAIRFPFSVVASDRRNLVQCIPQGKNNQIDWGVAYTVSGQMSDMKFANIPDVYRYVIIEDNDMEPDTLGTLANLLSESANVLQYSTRDNWIGRFLN